jgi:hypothetical protein
LCAYSPSGFSVINLSTDTPDALAIWDNVFTAGFFVAPFSIFTIVLCEMPVYCVINPFTIVVIPAEAGIQKNRDWMPHQVRHDMPTKSKEALDALH